MHSTMTTAAYRVRSYDLHDLDGISDKTMQNPTSNYTEGYVKETNSLTEHIRKFRKMGRSIRKKCRPNWSKRRLGFELNGMEDL